MYSRGLLVAHLAEYPSRQADLAVRARADAEVIAETPVVQVVPALAAPAGRKPKSRSAHSRPAPDTPRCAPACRRTARRRALAGDGDGTGCSARWSGDRPTRASGRARLQCAISASASSRVCSGNAYMRSRLKLSKFACAISTARRASRSSWMRPSACRCCGSKLWIPIESRLTPSARKSANFCASNVPGLASSVISASGDSGRRARIAGQDLVECTRGQQAGRAAAEENAVHAPPPNQRQRLLEVGGQRGNIALLGKLAARFMRVEVAVRALAHAPGDMHIQRQRRQCLEGHLDRAQSGARNQHGHDVTNCTRCAAIRAIRAEPAPGPVDRSPVD